MKQYALFSLLVFLCLVFVSPSVDAFSNNDHPTVHPIRQHITTSVAQLSAQRDLDTADVIPTTFASRRKFVLTTTTTAAAVLPAVASFFLPFAVVPTSSAAAASSDTTTKALLDQMESARAKLEPVPGLLQKEEWESVRQILKTPPVNFLWNMGDSKNPVLAAAKATDEFELIDLKDELSISLQMCDQLTYVFLLCALKVLFVYVCEKRE